MTKQDFTGKTAVITGGAQGIGLAVADRLARARAQVASWDMNAEQNTDAMNRLGGFATICDVSDAASVREALAVTESALGPVDILVNSAGIAGPNMPIQDYDDAAWHQIIAVNLTGTYNTNKAVIPGMRDRNYGRILNIASIAGKEGNPNACAYSASKAGVIGFTKSAGKENADKDIAINCVTPAAARTPIFDQMSAAHIEYMLSKIPRGRFLEVAEAANMIAWAVCAENAFTTGAVFDLSGGRATY
ncbi:SDR family NAD(P)-dependent oxidoreductase [Litoreibacter roseus]|uniref:Short-chain dehydrogenase/reductase SDR n=1 Tax=Litoreibacter roseus TaxID=2601869 RepID=A0A6N6JBJ0_9RHOB|nr:SDR family NAD(P)-dependent oxidoreductase [Litoreibacter roseus]GFE63633.1 short-chain dehydrogenase/reductase SDR [Litoreibacter roseus]